MDDDLNVVLERPLAGHELSFEIVEQANVATLLDWFAALQEQTMQLKQFITAFKFADVHDEEQAARRASALAFYSIAQRWIENRLLSLGIEPPYPPTDGRNATIRKLEVTIKDLQREVRDAQAMSAGTAKTEGLGAKPASAVRQDAPNL